MRKSSQKGWGDRDGGRFLAFPYDVIRSQAYRDLSYSARSLLIDIGLQFNGANNGKLVACAKYLRPIGWNSNATSTKALQELVNSGLLVLTRKGHKPNKASWFGLAWQAMGRNVNESELDITGRTFEAIRHDWKRKERALLIKTRPPECGIGHDLIAPKNGIEAVNLRPKIGAISSRFGDGLHQKVVSI